MNVYWIVIPGVLILLVGFLAFELTRRREQQADGSGPAAADEAAEEPASRR